MADTAFINEETTIRQVIIKLNKNQDIGNILPKIMSIIKNFIHNLVHRCTEKPS